MHVDIMRCGKNKLPHSTNRSTNKHTFAAIPMAHEVCVISPVLHTSSVAPDVADGCVCGVAGPHVACLPRDPRVRPDTEATLTSGPICSLALLFSLPPIHVLTSSLSRFLCCSLAYP